MDAEVEVVRADSPFLSTIEMDRVIPWPTSSIQRADQ